MRKNADDGCHAPLLTISVMFHQRTQLIAFESRAGPFVVTSLQTDGEPYRIRSLHLGQTSVIAPNPCFMAQLMSLERSLDRMRGGDGKSSTVDLERYRSNRFGDTNTFEATQQKFIDVEESLRKCGQNVSKNGNHHRNLSASSLLPFIDISPNNIINYECISEVDDDDSFFSGLCSACALDVFGQQLEDEGKGRKN